MAEKIEHIQGGRQRRQQYCRFVQFELFDKESAFVCEPLLLRKVGLLCNYVDRRQPTVRMGGKILKRIE